MTENKALNYAKTSLAFEGLYASKEQEQLVLSLLNDEISEEDFLQKALELANKISN